VVGTVGSVSASSVAFRRLTPFDPELLHPRDERSPLESKASRGAAWTANPAVGFFEGTDDLIAINFGENAAHRRASCRFRLRLVIAWCGPRAREQFRDRHI